MRPPPLRLSGLNRIPLERGLGSSSAATVAGVVLGSRIFDLSIDGHNALRDGMPFHDAYSVFAIAARIEGHPDNAAAAAFGGFTIALPDGDVRRLDVDPAVRPVALVPLDVRLPTAEARRALPDRVDRADAIYNAAHAALVVEALTRDPSLLRDALRDRLHQEVRLDLVPAVREVFRDLVGAGIPICVSGAGPTPAGVRVRPANRAGPRRGVARAQDRRASGRLRGAPVLVRRVRS